MHHFTLDNLLCDEYCINMNGIESIAEFVDSRCDLIEAHILPATIALKNVHVAAVISMLYS